MGRMLPPLAAFLGALAIASAVGFAQTRTPQPARTLTIPFLANPAKPADLEFMAAQCDIAANGDTMACRFRQVFLTVSGIDSQTCVITTNGYDETFRRTTTTRWVSETAPEGACGTVERATLDDGGGMRWTLTLESKPTRGGGPACRAPAPEVYDWTNVKRPLPCASIQPGAIER